MRRQAAEKQAVVARVALVGVGGLKCGGVGGVGRQVLLLLLLSLWLQLWLHGGVHDADVFQHVVVYPTTAATDVACWTIHRVSTHELRRRHGRRERRWWRRSWICVHRFRDRHVSSVYKLAGSHDEAA